MSLRRGKSFIRVAGRDARRSGICALHRAAAPIRRGYYTGGLRDLPACVKRPLGLVGDYGTPTRKIEVGSGFRPQPGYVHVDTDARAPHVEAHAPAWRLPFPDGWADQILSIHALEHIQPARMQQTLSEWRRVLRAGGVVRIHVPDSRALMEAFLAARKPEEKWPLIGAMLGMYANPGIQSPGDLHARADHQVLFDAALLIELLRDAGFYRIKDITSEVDDVHSRGWRPLIARISLVVEGVKP